MAGKKQGLALYLPLTRRSKQFYSYLPSSYGFDHDLITKQVVSHDFVKEAPKQTCLLPKVLATKQYTDNVEELLAEAVSMWNHATNANEQLQNI